ncbi:MAG: MBL fold metallo-hydrolase [Rhodothermales bacterium]|nr:MBL fold metallo-hydrolase [Rhodothermales bacterium]
MTSETPKYTAYPIEAGRFGLDGGAMFGVVPRPLWSRKSTPDDAGRIPLSTRCLLLEGEGRLILIDVGIGDKFDEKHRGIYAMEDGPGLVGGLRALGFEPGDVTDVVLTHLHFDHCGGATTWRDGASHVVFDRAVHHVQKAHWDWANKSNPREKASFLSENLDPLAAEGQLSLVDGLQEILPGISVEPVSGHTEAQQIVHIDGMGDGRTVYVADLIPTSAHLAPVWGMSYDLQPLLTIEEKTDFLRRAVEGDWRLFFEHDPFVESGRVVMEKGRPRLEDQVAA